MADREEEDLRRSRSRSVSRSCSGFSERRRSRSVSRSRSHRRSPSRSSSGGRSRSSSRGRRRTRRRGGHRTRSGTPSSDGGAEANDAHIEEARLLLGSGVVKFCEVHGTSLAASTCTPCRLLSRMVKPAVLTQFRKASSREIWRDCCRDTISCRQVCSSPGLETCNTYFV